MSVSSLLIEVSNCPSEECSCYVWKNRTGDLIPVNVTGKTSGKGSVTIKSLNPYTLYVFDLNCSEASTTRTYSMRTDVDRPSPPRKLLAQLFGSKLHFTWLFPWDLRGPIDEYRVTLDGVPVNETFTSSTFVYTMNKNYVAGTNHTISVSACNIDTQKRALCSDPKLAQLTFTGQATSDSTTSITQPGSGSSSKTKSAFLHVILLSMLAVKSSLYSSCELLL